jgi:outer membrane protein, heavy metal efflux system
MAQRLLFLIVLCLTNSVFADGALDLEAVVRMAAQNNPSLVGLQKEISAAQAEAQIEGYFGNPSLITEITRSQPNYFVGAGYLFELGGKRSKRIAVARGAVQLADIAYRQALQTLRHDVRIAYYELVVAQKKQTEVAQSRDLAQKLYDIANQRFELGDVARLEVLQASLEFKRRQNDFNQTAAETQAALVQLNALLHRDPQAAIELQDSTLTFPELNLDSLISKAVGEHYSLLSIRQQRATEEARLNLAKAGRVPDLDLEGGTEIHDADFQYGYRAALRLDLPFFNHKQGEILLANTNIERLKAEEEATTIKLRGDVSAAYLRYQASISRVRNYENDILPSAREIEQLAVESYQAGKNGIFSVIDAQRSIRDVQLEYLEALLQLQTALADLEQTSGVELK